MIKNSGRNSTVSGARTGIAGSSTGLTHAAVRTSRSASARPPSSSRGISSGGWSVRNGDHGAARGECRLHGRIRARHPGACQGSPGGSASRCLPRSISGSRRSRTVSSSRSLIELQGFPTLFAYQPVLCQEYGAVYDLPAGLAQYAAGVEAEAYEVLLRSAILGTRAPENVILLEIDPLQQKTLPDFLLTSKLCGISRRQRPRHRPEGEQALL